MVIIFPRRVGARQPGKRSTRRRRRGQGLVELVVILPVLLLVLVGAIDLGRVFYSYTAISNAAYEAARQAARGGYLYQPCVLNTSTNACDQTAMAAQICPSTDPNYQADAQVPGAVYQITTIYATLRCELGSLFNDAVTNPTDCTAAQSPNPTVTPPDISSPGALTPPVGVGCVGWGYHLSTDASGAQEVTITVTYNFALLTPMLLVLNGTNGYFTLARTVSVAILTAPGNPYPTPTP